tara:strand:- start:49 stop:582 length:534 start_codon:yes stop_codon:yes gene_type:complete
MYVKSLNIPNLHVWIISVVFFLVSNCANIDVVPNETDFFEDAMEARGNDLVGESTSLTDLLSTMMGTESSASFNRGITFDVVISQFSIMPLLSVDRVGGVIITDWYSASSNINERIKFNIIIKDEKMEDESIDIKMFKETFNGANWSKAPVDTETADKIKKLILEKSKRLQTTAELS